MGYRVLVVDDSATMRKILIRNLRQTGMSFSSIDEAADGTEALSVATATPFDLILSDVNMPGMNGIEFVEALHTEHESPPPVVMVTTEGGDAAVDAAMASGANGYLKKPFTNARLQELLTQFLEDER